jgi:uncharacterized membrane protein
MNLTYGEMLFYGSVLGMAVILLAAVIVIPIFISGWKRLRRRHNEEYGISKDKA